MFDATALHHTSTEAGRCSSSYLPIRKPKTTKSIPAAGVSDVLNAWYLARTIDLPINQFITLRPADIDDVPSAGRHRLWQLYRNKLSQFARDHDFETAFIWSRESMPGTGNAEHMHLCMHVPSRFSKKLTKTVSGWFEHADEWDVRRCSYRSYLSPAGKTRNIASYLTKNSPQAAYGGRTEFRRGGPIVGKRYGMSNNLIRNSKRARSAAI